jgi:hypothetical protein
VKDKVRRLDDIFDSFCGGIFFFIIVFTRLFECAKENGRGAVSFIDDLFERAPVNAVSPLVVRHYIALNIRTVQLDLHLNE